MFGSGIFSKIPKKVFIIITVLVFLIQIGLIFLYMKYPTKPLMVAIMIVSVLFVITINALVSKIAVFKPKKIKYPQEYYYGVSYLKLESKLLSAGFNKTSKNFGASFIKIDKETAYKILLISDYEKYFNNDEKDDSKPTKGIEKCTKFIGFELFYKYDEKVLTRLPDFSFKGPNVFYNGFFYHEETDTLVECNKQNPEQHTDIYNKFITILGLVKKDNPFNEEKIK